MALRSVIDIDVNTTQFDAFVTKFQQFQQNAKVNVGVTGTPGTGGGSVPGTTQPGSTGPVVTPATTPGAAPPAPGTTQPGSTGPTAKPQYGPPPPPPKPQFGPPQRVPIVPNVAPNPWLMRPPPAPNVGWATRLADALGLSARNSAQVTKNFSAMREHTTGVLKNIREMASRLLSISGSLALLTGAATGFGFLGFNELARTAGSRRQQAMQLGTTPGGQFATQTHLGRFGMGTQTLSEIGRLAGDITDKGHAAVQGMLPYAFNTQTDTAKAARDLLNSPEIQKILREPNADVILQQRGLGGLFTPEIRRSLSAAKPGEIRDQTAKAAETQRREEEKGPSDATLRRFQEFTEEMAKAGRAIEDLFIKNLADLGPDLVKLSKAITELLKAFLESPKLKQWITDLTVALGRWAEELKKPETQQAIIHFASQVGDAAVAVGKLAIQIGRLALWIEQHIPEGKAGTVAGGAYGAWRGFLHGLKSGSPRKILQDMIIGAGTGATLGHEVFDKDEVHKPGEHVNPSMGPFLPETTGPLKRPTEVIADQFLLLIRRWLGLAPPARYAEPPAPATGAPAAPAAPGVPAAPATPAPAPTSGDPWQLGRRPAAYRQPMPAGRSPFVQPAAFRPPANDNANPIQRAAAFRQQVDNPIQQAAFRTVVPAPATPAAQQAAPMFQDAPRPATGVPGGAPAAPQGTNQGPWDKPIPVLPWPLPLPVTIMDQAPQGEGIGWAGTPGFQKASYNTAGGGSQGGEGAGGGQDGGVQRGGGAGGGGAGGGGGGGGDPEGGRPGDFGGVANPQPGQAMAPAALRDMISSRLNIPNEQAAAIVSNFQAESGLKADLNEKNPLVKGSRGGYGLAQWTADRRRDLEGWAQKQGLDVRQHSTQVGFMAHELDTKFPGWRKKLNAAGNDPQEIAKVFFRLYESGGAASLEQHLGKHVRGARGVAALPPSTKEAVTNEANKIGRQDTQPTPQRPAAPPAPALQPAAPRAVSPIQQATINLRLDNQTGSNAAVSGGQLAA